MCQFPRMKKVSIARAKHMRQIPDFETNEKWKQIFTERSQKTLLNKGAIKGPAVQCYFHFYKDTTIIKKINGG